MFECIGLPARIHVYCMLRYTGANTHSYTLSILYSAEESVVLAESYGVGR